MKVLIVDDSAVMRRIVERALQQAGLDMTEVVHATNGSEGLDRLREAATTLPFDLILSDLHMPQMSGLEFLRQKRAQNLAPNAPVLIVTGDGADPAMLDALALGAQGHISKPFTLDQIQAQLKPLLQAAA